MRTSRDIVQRVEIRRGKIENGREKLVRSGRAIWLKSTTVREEVNVARGLKQA